MRVRDFRSTVSRWVWNPTAPYTTGWTKAEHNRLVRGVRESAGDWAALAKVVGTKSDVQCRKYATACARHPKTRAGASTVAHPEPAPSGAADCAPAPASGLDARAPVAVDAPAPPPLPDTQAQAQAQVQAQVQAPASASPEPPASPMPIADPLDDILGGAPSRRTRASKRAASHTSVGDGDSAARVAGRGSGQRPALRPRSKAARRGGSSTAGRAARSGTAAAATAVGPKAISSMRAAIAEATAGATKSLRAADGMSSCLFASFLDTICASDRVAAAYCRQGKRVADVVSLVGHLCTLLVGISTGEAVCNGDDGDNVTRSRSPSRVMFCAYGLSVSDCTDNEAASERMLHAFELICGSCQSLHEACGQLGDDPCIQALLARLGYASASPPSCCHSVHRPQLLQRAAKFFFKKVCARARACVCGCGWVWVGGCMHYGLSVSRCCWC